MARKQTLDAILGLFKKLGGNTSEILGTKTNVNFIGKGEPEMLQMDINPEALGAISQSKVIDELKNSVSYAASGKLNDLQAGKLLENMSKIDEFYNPPPGPANITDLATGTRNLDREGLMSLRDIESRSYYNKPGFRMPEGIDPEDLREMSPEEVKELLAKQDIAAPVASAEETFKNTQNELRKELERLNEIDLPKDIDIRETTLPTGAGLEALKNVKNNNLIINDLVDKVYDMAGVAKTAQPVARGNARDFLNTIKDMEDPTFPGGTTLSSVMEVDDFKFATEGGGGGMGDPLLLVQKYFGPRVAAAVSKLEGRDQIELFANRLVRVKDAKGNTITDRGFDPNTVDPNDFEFKEGGRVGYRGGKLVGKALGMFKRQQALERGMGEGFAAAEQYGITGPMVSKLFRELAMDKSLVGQEKTQYMKLINEVLKNPEKYPDEILQIQKKLGLDIDVGMKGGGLAKILEV